jgi:hypothetical protein
LLSFDVNLIGILVFFLEYRRGCPVMCLIFTGILDFLMHDLMLWRSLILVLFNSDFDVSGAQSSMPLAGLVCAGQIVASFPTQGGTEQL